MNQDNNISKQQSEEVQIQPSANQATHPKSNKKLILVHIILVLIIIGTGAFIFFKKDTVATTPLKTISFNSSLEAPVSFKYPDNWTVVRDSTSEKAMGNPDGLYEKITITSPSKKISVDLFADHGFIGQAGGCTKDGLWGNELPYNVVKLDNYAGHYYIEQISSYNSSDDSKGLVFDAHMSRSTFCLGSQIIYNASKHYDFTAGIDIKEFDSIYKSIDEAKVVPQVVVTQSMIDRVIASGDYKAAKAILLSATKTK